ncbi:MAG TPA: DUF3617 family protein [Xanthobacteraceae bacterium]|nr:DUF3617 family protein [Xanthobacteraceae bacterium]
MCLIHRLCLFAVTALVLTPTFSLARAEGIQAGLWKITTVAETGGMNGPPHDSFKCLTAEQVKDLPATFSPQARTINSICAPIERTFDGEKLHFHLICKGQLDMELTGAFDFDSQHHYTGRVEAKAAIAGQTMPPSIQKLDANWVSECK